MSDKNTIPKLKKVDGKWTSVLNGESWVEKEVAKLTYEEVGDTSRIDVEVGCVLETR